MKKNECIKCGHLWVARVEKPAMCPKCKSYKWNEKKVKKSLDL